MRIIKFRGKDIETGEWIYGDLIHPMGHYPAILSIYPTVEGKVGYSEIAVNEETIGQFTGLYDKNKNEIYEGDILNVPGTLKKIEVRFVRGVFAFLWNGNLDDESPVNTQTQEWAEIIGNIHDNPKLLKRKNERQKMANRTE